jgi:hypothetical protein
MKQKQKCSQCGQDYFTTMLKVYVFKKHTCPVDKTILTKSQDGNVFECPSCKKTFSKENPVEWNNMGIKIEGSTQSFEDKNSRLAEEPNIEVANVMVPEDTICQRCQNWQTRSMQATQKRERKLAMGMPEDIKAIPDTVTDADIFRYEVFRKTNEEFQAARKAEAYEQQKAERAMLEEQRQAQLAEDSKKSLFPTKEEMKPLIDPETAKLIEDVKKKDAHIAELKMKLEEAKKKEEEKAKES